MLKGRAAEPFDFGWLARCISLGRRDALVQWVDRDDAPRESVTTGRAAVLLKKVASGGQIPALRIERRLPGANRWPRSADAATAPGAHDAAAAA